MTWPPQGPSTVFADLTDTAALLNAIHDDHVHQ